MRINSISLATLLAATVSLTAACSGVDDAGLWTGRVDTLESGTVVVSNSAIPIWSPSETWSVEEVARIGELDGTGAKVFGSIGLLEVDSTGKLYLFDTQADELRIISNDGDHLRTLGRSGAGPNEFQNVIGMQFAPNGDLWLVDATNARYTRVRNDEVVDSFRRPATLYKLPWLGGFDVSGSFYDQVTENIDGKSVDVLLKVQANDSTTEKFPLPMVDMRSPRIGTMEFPLPFAPKMLRSWDTKGAVWTAVSSEYRIALVGKDGDTAAVVSREFKPLELTANQRDSVDKYVRNLEAQFPMVVVAPQSRASNVSPLRWFFVDDESYLWVCATGLARCSELDVFDPKLRWLGTVSLPIEIMDSPRPLVRGDMFYAVIEGESGEPQLYKGRIVRK